MKLQAPKPVAIRAVHPNAGVMAWYANRLQDWLDAMHDSLKLHIEAAYKREPPTIGMAHDASSTVALRKALKLWGDRWRSKFDEMSQTLAEQFAAKSFKTTQISMMDALKQGGFTVAFKPTAKSIEAYRAVVNTNVGLIKSVPAQYLKEVEQSVWNSVMKGGDLATLSKSLQQNYGVSYKRAAIIARTENGKATAIIQATRQQELGLKQAIWLHSGGGRVPRPTHVAMSGKPFDLGKGMWDRDERSWVFPGQLINCRCVSKALIPGFDD